MGWSYDGDPEGDRKDEVRMMVGDTDSTDELLQDEEINYILTLYPPTEDKPAWLAAAHACDAIAGRFGRKMQRSIGPLAASAQQQWEHYRQMAADFRMLYQTNGIGNPGGLGAVAAAAPVLGGGGQTYLGNTPDFYRRD